MRIIHSVYNDQLAAVRLPDLTTNWFRIKRGVRQGCVMSPDLFNLYSEVILRDLQDRQEGVVVNGININNLRYADDTVLIATSEEDLQNIFNAVVVSSKNFGLNINSKKTKVMVISKSENIPTCQLFHNATQIEQVSSFNYLGAIITSDSRCKKEILRRIGLAKDTFKKLQTILKDRKLSIAIKLRLLKAYVWSTLLYGCESWTLTAETLDRLSAAEMWFYRRMLRISYVDRVTNEEVLQGMNTTRQLIDNIKKRQMKFLGHQIRRKSLEHLSLTGKFKGKRAKGGQRKTFLKNYNQETLHLIRSAEQREEYRIMIHQTSFRR